MVCGTRHVDIRTHKTTVEETSPLHVWRKDHVWPREMRRHLRGGEKGKKRDDFKNTLTVGEGVVNRSNRLYGAESFVTYVLASSERRRQKRFNTESVAKVNGKKGKKEEKKTVREKITRHHHTLTDIVLCFGRSRARLHAGRELRCRRTSIMLRAVRQSDH